MGGLEASFAELSKKAQLKGLEQLAWEQGLLGGVAFEVSVACLSPHVYLEVGPVGVELRGRGRCELEEEI